MHKTGSWVALMMGLVGCAEGRQAAPADPLFGLPAPSLAQPNALQAPRADAPLAPVTPAALLAIDESELAAMRDPFQPYLSKEPVTPPDRQHIVLSPDSALDEISLKGVVGGDAPRVLLVDKAGFGWIARAGDYVGRAEPIAGTGATGQEVFVGWRVDRIREGDVVFVQEDVSRPWIPVRTKVVALHPKAGPGTSRL